MTRWAFWFLISSGPGFACEAVGQRAASDAENAPEVYVFSEVVPLAQPFSILIEVCNETPVREILVDAIMPAHQHGLNYTPKVTALDEGKFRIDDLLFHMPGLWELQVDLDFNGQSVSYTSELALR